MNYRFPMIPDALRPHDTRQVATLIRRLKLTGLPAEVTAGPATIRPHEGHERVNSIVQRRDHLDDAADAVLRGEDPTDHMILAAAWSFHEGLAQRVQQRSQDGYIDTINANADAILTAVKQQVFNPTIEKLRGLADKHPDVTWNLDTALGIEDYEQAQRIKALRPTIQRLVWADELRRLIHPDAYEGDAAWTNTPGLIPDVPDPEDLASAGWWMSLILDGHEPVYDTAAEWWARDHSERFTEFREAAASKVPVQNLAWAMKN
ncbi:hypothetical protein ACQ3I4_11205 [Zafaria sp. Z1313]|uniref:hypothetical protein n=1 Tax=Zafaria sp. Z1313 TaxID=3423202 RepID=UPI003D30349C